MTYWIGRKIGEMGLEYVDDILDDGTIEKATMEAAKAVFSEREIVELTWQATKTG